MTVYLQWTMRGIARKSIREKINAWCKKNSDKIKTGNALSLMYSVKIDNDPSNIYKLTLISYPISLFNIVISPNGVINECFYEFVFPEHHKLFSDLFNSHFRFVELLAKGMTYPDKYPNVINFIKDVKSGLFRKFGDERLISALSFLMTPNGGIQLTDLNSEISYLSLTSNKTTKILASIDKFKQLHDNITLLFEVIEEYNTHPLAKLMKLQL